MDIGRLFLRIQSTQSQLPRLICSFVLFFSFVAGRLISHVEEHRVEKKSQRHQSDAANRTDGQNIASPASKSPSQQQS